MVGTFYFHALMDEMPKLMGTSSRTLDRDDMKGSVLYNYIACYNFLVGSSFIHRSPFCFCPCELLLSVLQTSLATMKAKKLEQDFEDRIQAATISFKGEVEKLEKEKEKKKEKEKESQVAELKIVVDNLNVKQREEQQKNKDLNEELRRERSLQETSNSKLTGELNKAKEEL